MSFQIDPKTSLWLNAAYLILTGLTAPMLQAAGIANAPMVIAWAGLLAFPINVILHLYSSTNPGPLAPQDVKP